LHDLVDRIGRDRFLRCLGTAVMDPAEPGPTPVLRSLQGVRQDLKRSMRQQRRAGEKLFIDYAGPTRELAHGGVQLISVQKVTVRPSPESKHWRGL
jgi:hypothetical protein